jgi:hypothetical protein
VGRLDGGVCVAPTGQGSTLRRVGGGYGRRSILEPTWSSAREWPQTGQFRRAVARESRATEREEAVMEREPATSNVEDAR